MAERRLSMHAAVWLSLAGIVIGAGAGALIVWRLSSAQRPAPPPPSGQSETSPAPDNTLTERQEPLHEDP
ncbi:MAG: hypothetical protein IBJ10_06395 [Phycisphaerales bacterium]|nr:hypothetical protein [Phycisphaerales bacterium]